MAKHVKQSVVPIYLVGGVWLASGLFFSLHRVSDYALCGVLSAAAYVAGRALFPDKTYELPDEPEKKKEEKPKSTGNPEIDKLIAERDKVDRKSVV